MVRLARRGRAGERGNTIVLVALTMVAMLTFTAIAVDLSNARQRRRLLQNTADGAALAAAQELIRLTVPLATRDANAVATAKTYVNANYGPVTWAGCDDDLALPVQPEAGNQCISLDAERFKVRVRMPVENVETAFGGIVGIGSVPVRAAAAAYVGSPYGDRITPVAITPASGTGNLCIENTGNEFNNNEAGGKGGGDAACASRTAGNFGGLISPRLVRFITAPGDDSEDALRVNYALGTDHPLDTFVSGSAAVCDGNLASPPCSTTNRGTPYVANHMHTRTGNAINTVTDGLVDGFTANVRDPNGPSTYSVEFCGRLRRLEFIDSMIDEPMPGGACTPPSPTMTVYGSTQINGRHISYWMTDAAKNVFYPSADPTAQPVSAPGTADGYDPNPATYDPAAGRDDLLHCFTKNYRYVAATGTDLMLNPAECPGLGSLPSPRAYGIFEKEIITDPRFGWLPVLAEFPSGGSTVQPVVRFWAIYVYRLYTQGQKVRAVDAWVFDPFLIEAGTNTSGPSFGYKGGPAVITLVQ